VPRGGVFAGVSERDSSVGATVPGEEHAEEAPVASTTELAAPPNVGEQQGFPESLHAKPKLCIRSRASRHRSGKIVCKNRRSRAKAAPASIANPSFQVVKGPLSAYAKI
jgi:hypothetical protein